MKKTLFGGMKVKGPSAKQEEQKKTQQSAISQTNLSTDSKPQPQHVSKAAQLKVSTKSLSSEQPTPIIQPQLKQSKTSLQSVLKQEKPKLQTKQSIKESSTSQKILSSSSNLAQQKEKQSAKQARQSEEEQKIIRKDFSKSRSEKNYDGEDSEDNNDIREDRSVVVGRQQEEEKEEIEVKKNYKGKMVGNAPKSNPLLNQIKKISTKAGQQQKDKQTESSQIKQPIQKGTKSPNLPLSTTQKSKRQKSTILQQLTSSHTRILQHLTKQKTTKSRIIELTNHLMELKEELSVLTNKQNHYIATEEYELADKLEGKITGVTGKISEEEGEIGLLQEELFKMEIDGVTVVRAHMEEEKRTIRRLKLVELDIEDEVAHFKRQQDERIQSSKASVQNQKKKYQRIVTDIKNQSQQLEKYQKTFYEDLNSRKSPLEQHLSDQQNKRTELQQEIKQLQEKLKKKRNLLKTTLSNIQSTRQKITQVDNTFEEEKQKLEERKKHITQLQGEKHQQNKKLLELEDQVKQLEKQKAEQVTKMTRQKQSYNKLSLQIEQFFSSIDVEEYLAKKKHIIEQFMKHSKSLKHFEETHKEKRQQITDLEFQKSNTLSEITKNQDRIKELKQKIPKLQNQQKQLSLAKNFKGAGMKKTEIKECTDAIEEIKKLIEDAYATEAQIDAKIEEINSEQEKYVEEQNLLRKQLALSQFSLAVEKKKELVRELEWLKELEKGVKMKEMYESKMKQELNEIQEEINYIAQEYELQEEKQDKPAKSKVSQKPSRSSNTNNNVSQVNQNSSDSSYARLTVNDNQQTERQANDEENQRKEKSVSSSNQPLEQEEKEEGKEQGQQEGHENLESPDSLQQESTYQPLQLEINDGQEPEERQTNQVEDEEQETNQVEDEEQQPDQKNNQYYHKQEQQQEQDSGYVPLHLD